jgi:hypothetical protein
MAFEVLRTPQVRDAVQRQMSRTERASYEAARDELAGRGCVAGGYKLAATDGGDYPLCARHLANAWRMYTAYPDDARVVIVAVDQHTPESNPAASLAETLPGLATVGRCDQSIRNTGCRGAIRRNSCSSESAPTPPKKTPTSNFQRFR